MASSKPPFEQGEIGPALFRKACEFGLEGLVSKHQERAYRPGPSTNWVKVKNPKHPAMKRGEEWNVAKVAFSPVSGHSLIAWEVPSHALRRDLSRAFC